ncbi:MAG: hypothetical protein KA004_09185 [Verrucomicrobiales bacterium]|nr:hypothetical protein [Verrucomicrobiales bacterium]
MIDINAPESGMGPRAGNLYGAGGPGPAESPLADTQKLAQEINAMEAVRELLLGTRMGELQERIRKAEESLTQRVEKAETILGERAAALEAGLRREAVRMETGMVQALSAEATARELMKGENGNRFSECEARLIEVKRELDTLIVRQQQDVFMLRKELLDLGRNLSSELARMRTTMPTVEGLTELFRQASERMRGAMKPAEVPPAREATPVLRPLVLPA